MFDLIKHGKYAIFRFPVQRDSNKVKGVDMFGRSFIILKVGIFDIKIRYSKNRQVFFQRYAIDKFTLSAYFYNWQAYLDGDFLIHLLE